MPRPVMLDQLKKKIEEMYSYPLNMFFTQANGEVTVHFQALYNAGCPDDVHIKVEGDILFSVQILLALAL